MGPVEDKWLEKYILAMDSRLASLDDKVDRLLQFKWQIIGGSVVISAVLTIFIQVIFSLVNT